MTPNTFLVQRVGSNGKLEDRIIPVTANSAVIFDAYGDPTVTPIGSGSGLATLVGGKLAGTQIPDALLGALNYQGTWNANTNSPTIPAAGDGNKGWYYKVATAGASSVDGIADWKVGDFVLSNGTTWDKIDNTDPVAQQLIEKKDFQSTPLGNGSTMTITPTAAMTVVDVVVGTASNHAATLNIAGGTVGDIVLVNYMPWVGNAQKGTLNVSFDGVLAGSYPSWFTNAPQQITFKRVRDDSPFAAAANWIVVGRQIGGAPALTNHVINCNDAPELIIKGARGPQLLASLSAGQLPVDGESFTLGIYDAFSTSSVFSMTFEWDNDGSLNDPSAIPIDISTAMVLPDYLAALVNAFNGVAGSYLTTPYVLDQVLVPDASGSIQTATIGFKFPELAGANFQWQSLPSSPGFGTSTNWPGEDASPAGRFDFGGVTWNRFEGTVILGDGMGIDGPNVDIVLTSSSVGIGVIPAGTAAGTYPLAQFLTNGGRRASRDSLGGGFLEISVPPGLTTGYANIILHPQNIQRQLVHAAG